MRSTWTTAVHVGLIPDINKQLKKKGGKNKMTKGQGSAFLKAPPDFPQTF